MTNHPSTNQNPVLIYQAEDGSFQMEVYIQADTVWLTQKQMSDLFKTSTDNISLHLKNIYLEGELFEDATTEDYSVVRHEGSRKVKRLIKHYNLDVIISVGYRVNSKEGTQFRIWVNQIFKKYLLQGYALNETRLKQHMEAIDKLKRSFSLIQNISTESLKQDEAKGLLKVLTEYTQSFILLNQYDTGNFPKNGLSQGITQEIPYDEAIHAIQSLKEKLFNARRSDFSVR